MRPFAAIYLRLTSGLSTNAAVETLERYLCGLNAEDASWAYALLNGCSLRKLVLPSVLRQWVTELSGYPDWMIDACHEQSGNWPETLSKLMPTTEGSEPDPLAEFMAKHVLGLMDLDIHRRREAVFQVYPHLTEGERVLYLKWLSGSYRLPRFVRDAMALCAIEPMPPPALLHKTSRQNLLF